MGDMKSVDDDDVRLLLHGDDWRRGVGNWMMLDFLVLIKLMLAFFVGFAGGAKALAEFETSNETSATLIALTRNTILLEEICVG